MRRRLQLATVLVGCELFCAGCSLFDSGVEWRDGKYALIWIDLPDEVSLSYEVSEGGWVGLVEPRVFAVGADDRYVVAKQHPGGDRLSTHYFIVDRRQDVVRHSERAITGPLTETEFQRKATELRLPPFTKVLESLK
jgi:hypothetical protein